MATVTHRCSFCDSDYPCDTFRQGEDEHGRERSACDCKSTTECPGCSEHGACERCGKAPAGDDRAMFFCADCAEATEDSRNEKAHEQMLDDYYGGGGPQSDRERFDVDSMNRVKR